MNSECANETELRVIYAYSSFFLVPFISSAMQEKITLTDCKRPSPNRHLKRGKVKYFRLNRMKVHLEEKKKKKEKSDSSNKAFLVSGVFRSERKVVISCGGLSAAACLPSPAVTCQDTLYCPWWHKHWVCDDIELRVLPSPKALRKWAAQHTEFLHCVQGTVTDTGGHWQQGQLLHQLLGYNSIAHRNPTTLKRHNTGIFNQFIIGSHNNSKYPSTSSKQKYPKIPSCISW